MTKPKDDFIDRLNAEFNTETDGSETASSTRTEDFGKMLEDSFKRPTRKLSVGDKIKGKILVLGREDVFVATGAQQDGVIARRDLNEPDGTCKYKEGDVVDLYVTQVRREEIRLSRTPTDKNIAEDLEDAFDMMLPVQGRIVEVCKGGVRVNIKGKLAFCPISQIDARHIENGAEAEYVGKSFEFRITQFSEGGRNIVVSRRKLLEEEKEANTGSFLEEHKDGDVVPGKVVRLEPFGAFVELAPGVDGLVHISEIAWSRIGSPGEVLQVGQPVTVKVLKRETVNGRVKISLSIKQVTPREEAVRAAGDAGAQGQPGSPWAKYSVGQTVSGKIQRKELYGVFVQLEPGITGLLHKSRVVEHPDFQMERLKVGDEISVQIGELKPEERRISLELPRDPNEGDWKNYAKSETSGGGFGTLGDMLKASLDKKKK